MIGLRGPACRGLFERIMGTYCLANGLCPTPCDRAAESSGSRQSRVWFCRALNCLPFLLPPLSSVSASRYFKAVPRAPSRVLDRGIKLLARGGPRFAFLSPIVRAARFPFQMSFSLEPSCRSSRSPFTIVARCSFLSHSSISPPAVHCCCC